MDNNTLTYSDKHNGNNNMDDAPATHDATDMEEATDDYTTADSGTVADSCKCNGNNSADNATTTNDATTQRRRTFALSGSARF